MIPFRISISSGLWLSSWLLVLLLICRFILWYCVQHTQLKWDDSDPWRRTKRAFLVQGFPNDTQKCKRIKIRFGFDIVQPTFRPFYVWKTISLKCLSRLVFGDLSNRAPMMILLEFYCSYDTMYICCLH